MEHSDYSIYGSEFVDFLSETLIYRLLNRFKKKACWKRDLFEGDEDAQESEEG